jgi:hypothetical protein
MKSPTSSKYLRLWSAVGRWVRGGGLRPIVVIAMFIALFVALPDRNWTLRDAHATSTPACSSGVGIGGTRNAAIANTIGGHGCVVIKYVDAGVATYATFNYTGADQRWTVPSGVTSASFHLLGAGGGGSDESDATYKGGNGGGAGYAAGTYTVTAGQVYVVIVGQAGGGAASVDVGASVRGGGYREYRTPATYGGGGRGGSISNWTPGYASGGGRSAIRLQGSASDVVTAGGGGGAGSTPNTVTGGSIANGGPGGGTSGTASGPTYGGGGGTQSAGGNGGSSGWGSVPPYGGTSGVQFLGGDSADEGGGGGGGWFGGGGGGDSGNNNSALQGGWGGGGGSSYVALLTNGSTAAGSGTSPGGAINTLATAGGVPSRPSLADSCSASNQNISYGVTQSSAGASAITNYEYHLATSRPTSDPTSWTAFSPAQTSSTLTWDMRALGFVSGQSYKFYVRAVNAYGNSESSWNTGRDSGGNCTVSFSASAPSAPTSLTATAGSGSASISFTAGSGNGASITNYSYSLNGTTYTELSPVDATSPVTIPGLTGGTSYTIYLKAINSVGSSSASTSVSVTPLAAAPTVSSVSGTSGTAAGGTSITITGTNFLTGATVTVGGAACTSVTRVSSTSITCTTPAGSAGAQDVVVTNTDTQSATLSGSFTYIAAPAAPSTPDLDSGSDSGSSSSDNVTSDSTPTISVGSVSNGNTVTVTAAKAGSTSVTCTFTATGQSSCDLGTLADGVWSITSKQTNSGIDSAASTALSLTIDTTKPTVSSFSSTTANGSYGIGATVNITATLSEAVADGASITVALDTGDTVVLTKATSTTLTGTYTVGTGDNSADLTVLSYTLTSAPTDMAGNATTSTALPTGANNIAGAQAIVIDTTPPTLSSATANTAGTQVTLTFSEPIHATTAAASDFAVSVGSTSITVSAVSVSGSTVILTLGTSADTGDVISVVYTAPASNSATSNSAIQDTVGVDAVSFTTNATVPATTTTTANQGGGGSAQTSTATSTTTTTTTTTTSTTTTKVPAANATTTTTRRNRPTTTSTTTTTTAFTPLAPLQTLVPTTSSAVAGAGAGAGTSRDTAPLPIQFTEPNPRVPVVDAGVAKIVEGVGAVAGMAPDGWVKVEPIGENSVVLTTSDDLRIEIAALTNENKKVRLNSRGMVIVEHDDFITVAGSGLQPNSDASTWLFSTPKELGQLKVDSNGEFTQRYQIGPEVEVGDHTAQINGITPDGTLRSVEVGVEVIARPAVAGPYDPKSEPRKVIDLTVEAMVLLAALGAIAARKEERESADVAEVSVSFRGSNTVERTDMIRPPVMGVLDQLSFSLPTGVVRKSPMVARIFADGSYLRGLFGAIWLLLPLAGVLVGAMAAQETSYSVIMPSFILMAIIMVIGIADAFSGFAAMTTFALLALLNGGFSSTDSVRGILGLWVLAFAVPLAGAAVRPFRRLASGMFGTWQRATDFVLVALFGAWAAGAMFSALPALTGFKTIDADRIDAIRLIALVALAVRYGIENIARVVVPTRLTSIENQNLPEVSDMQKTLSAIVRTAVFIFVAWVFIGNNWALWLGGAMYLVPKLIGLRDERFPDFKPLHRFLPRGILKTVVMLFVAKWWGSLVAENVPNADEMVQYGFVLLGIPGLLLGVLGWFGRSSKPWSSTIASKLLGIVLLIIGLVTVL